MKAKLLTLTIALIGFSFAHAQNVGIGQNNPASKLDVKGGVTIGTTYSGTYPAPANGAIIQGNVGIGTATPNSNAILDLSGATNQGLLLPQVTSGYESGTLTGLLSSPTSAYNGLIFYNSTTNCLDMVAGNSSGSGVIQSIYCPCPVIAPAVAGNTTVCPLSTNTYAVTNTTGATSYSWSAPGTTGSSTTNTISITAPSSGNYTVNCTVTNACNNTYTASLPVTLSSLPATPSWSGTNTSPICSSSTPTYTITAVSGATSYSWTFTNNTTSSMTIGGQTIAGSGGTYTFSAVSNLSYTATSLGSTSGTLVISVVANNSCGSSATPRTATITISTPPSTAAITAGGGQSVCVGNTAASNLVGNSNSIASGTGAWSVTNGPSGYSSSMITFGSASSATTSVAATSGAVPGSYTITWTISSSPCTPNSTATTTLNVQSQTITLTSGTSTQSVNAGSAMTSIVYTLGGTATSASIAWSGPSGGTSAPTGVSFNSSTYTISGTVSSSATPGVYSYTITTSGSSCSAATATGTITVNTTTIVLDASPLANANAGGTSAYTWTTSAITTSGYVGEIIFFDLEAYYGGTGLTCTAVVDYGTGYTTTANMTLLASQTYSSGSQTPNHYLFYYVTTTNKTSYEVTFTTNHKISYLATEVWSVMASGGSEQLTASNLTTSTALGLTTATSGGGGTLCSTQSSISVTTPSSPTIPGGSYLMSAATIDDYQAATPTFTCTTGSISGTNILIGSSSDGDGDNVIIGGEQVASSTSSVKIYATDSYCNYEGASIFSFWVHP